MFEYLINLISTMLIFSVFFPKFSGKWTAETYYVFKQAFNKRLKELQDE